MNKTRWTAVLHFCSFLILTTDTARIGAGQQPTNAAVDSKNVSDALKAIDELTEQNRKLAQQNQQLMQQNQALMEQINSLRPSVAKQGGAAQPAPTQTASSPVQQAPAGTAPQPLTQAADQVTNEDQSSDDKTLMPEASGGNSAIFGEFNPGRGFTVAKGEDGELNLSGYMAVRYLNQLPPDQTATDHLGRPIAVEPRNDFQFHRVMLFSQGWLFSPKFQYSTFVWTVQDTNQVAVGGTLYYNFGKYMTIGAGWNAYPGTMSLQGSHPYWESYDRVMADEFFRPYFSQGVFAQGNLLPTLQYRWMVGNNNSNLDVPAAKLDRDLSAGFALTWLPTTGEFGPRGAFGDYERHQKLATRFNLAWTYIPRIANQRSAAHRAIRRFVLPIASTSLIQAPLRTV
jgi:hypothetical protein